MIAIYILALKTETFLLCMQDQFKRLSGRKHDNLIDCNVNMQNLISPTDNMEILLYAEFTYRAMCFGCFQGMSDVKLEWKSKLYTT